MNTDIASAARAAVESQNWGRATAAKRGNNPNFPYIPVIAYDDRARTHNPAKRIAFATREEAIAFAQRHIDELKASVVANLIDPRYRALRESYGLPREILR